MPMETSLWSRVSSECGTWTALLLTRGTSSVWSTDAFATSMQLHASCAPREHPPRWFMRLTSGNLMLHRPLLGLSCVRRLCNSVTSSSDGTECADNTTRHFLEFQPGVNSIGHITGEFFLDVTTPSFTNISVASLSNWRERGMCNGTAHRSVCVECVTTIRHSTVLYVILYGLRGRLGHAEKTGRARRVVRQAPRVLALSQITSPVTTSSASPCHPSRPLRRFVQGSDCCLTLCTADGNLCRYHRHLRSFHLSTP